MVRIKVRERVRGKVDINHPCKDLNIVLQSAPHIIGIN
jgi:hypothetical protein